MSSSGPISKEGGRERGGERVNTICAINLPRLTSSKQFSPEVVEVLRREASLGVRVEEAV